MSDLFAPIPLPSRPVEQTADVAERDAAAKNREIDTRMRERLETGRQKMVHEFAVIERDETERKYKAQLDKMYNLSIPTNLYNRGVSSLAKRFYQQRQKDNSRQLEQQEQGRLSSQQATWDVRLNRIRNDLTLRVSQEGLSPEEALEIWQEQIKEVSDGTLTFSGDPSYSGYNLAAFKKINETTARETKSFTNSVYDSAQGRVMAGMNGSIQSAFSEAFGGFSGVQDVPGDVLGVGVALAEIPSWKAVERLNDEVKGFSGQSIYTPGTRLHGMAGDAIETRLANAALIEIQTSVKAEAANAPEGFERRPLTDHIHQGMLRVLNSPLFEDTSDFFGVSAKDINNIVKSKTDHMLAMEKAANQEALDQLNVRVLNGDYQTVSPQSFYAELRSSGVPAGQARARSVEHGKAQEDIPWLQNQRVASINEENNANEQASLEMVLRGAIEGNPEHLGTADETRTDIQRLVASGALKEGAWERIESLLDESQKGLLSQYGAVFRAADDFVNTLANDGNVQRRFGTGLGSLYLLDGEGNRTESLATLRARLTEDITSWILNGEPDGESRLTPEGMSEKFRRLMVTEASALDLKKRTRNNISGLATITGGEAVEMESVAIRPLPGVAAASGRSLVGSIGGQDLSDKIADLPRDQQAPFAVRQIPLSAYNGSEGDGAVHEQNLAALRGLAMDGHIRRFAYIPDDRAFEIQLAENGQWFRRSLDASKAIPLGKNLAEDLLAVEDVQIAVEDITSQGEGNLFYWHVDPATGNRQAYPTAGAEAMAASVQNLSITMLAIARLVREQGLGVLANMDLSSILIGGGQR